MNTTMPPLPRRHILLRLGAMASCAWTPSRAQPAEPAPAPTLGTEPLVFPRDFGAHPAFRTEWWYLTGTLRPVGAPPGPEWGFQVTFFRSRVDAAAGSRSAFAARQLVFAHAAISDPAGGELQHDQRIARVGFGLAAANEGDTGLTLRDWVLSRSGSVDQSTYRSRIRARAFDLNLRFDQTQPLLLQGQGGHSTKSPDPAFASRYYSLPHLRVTGQLQRKGRLHEVEGRAWLDHEWGERLLDPSAVGWDWVGMNLRDGGALTAFQLRRADGSTLWAGGSLRTASGETRSLPPQAVRFTPRRTWVSPATRARYPVEWTLEAAGRRFTIRPRLDAQEVDSRASTGNVYWEGLSDLMDENRKAVGTGYLEMTGYASPLKL